MQMQNIHGTIIYLFPLPLTQTIFKLNVGYSVIVLLIIATDVYFH